MLYHAAAPIWMVVNCFGGVVDRQNALAIFPSRIIVKDFHHRESTTRRE